MACFDSVMVIRVAVPGDAEGVARVQIGSYKSAYAGILPQLYLVGFSYEEQTQNWYELLRAELDDVVCVAEMHPENIIGYALGRSGQSGIRPYDAELVAIHVLQPYQGKGVGSQLIKEMTRQLKDRGCKSLMLWTLEKNNVRAWYEKIGGGYIGEKDWGGNEYFDVQLKEVAYGWLDIEELIR
jgi:GNAT superfamily N-acetyltransferase